MRPTGRFVACNDFRPAAVDLASLKEKSPRGTLMNRVDEEIRGVVNDGLMEAGVDVRNLAIEVDGAR